MQWCMHEEVDNDNKHDYIDCLISKHPTRQHGRHISVANNDKHDQDFSSIINYIVSDHPI